MVFSAPSELPPIRDCDTLYLSLRVLDLLKFGLTGTLHILKKKLNVKSLKCEMLR